MATSFDVTYQGDARFPERTKPFELHGFPFHFPIGEPVEITQEFIKETFNREDPVKDFVTFLFDGPKAVWNLHLKAPRFTVREHVEQAAKTVKSAGQKTETAAESCEESLEDALTYAKSRGKTS